MNFRTLRKIKMRFLESKYVHFVIKFDNLKEADVMFLIDSAFGTLTKYTCLN